ncbi:MAG: YceI family protein, partial [Spirosomaceae bacterium]|nr:YceI family protein [Spirosomataceae bacterium]
PDDFIDLVRSCENDLANSKFAVSLDVASINTGNGMKNKHAKSDKWFDAEKYPKITFTSNKFTKTAAGYSVEGTLDLHGVKKPVSIPFTFANNTFKGSLKVNRMDYGVGTMEGMSKKVSNEIVVDISVPVTK